MQGKFVTSIESELTGGNCVADVLRLSSGALVVIADDCVCIYDMASDWDGSDGEDSACVNGPRLIHGAEGFQRDDDAPHYFVASIETDEPDGPVSTDLITMHDGRVIGIDRETLYVYPNREAFGAFGEGSAEFPGDWLYDQNPQDGGCPECERSNGPNYDGPCEHGDDHGAKASTIRAIIETSPSLAAMLDGFSAEDDELLDMDEASGCGADCAKVLRAGAQLIAMLPDVQNLRPDLIVGIQDALEKQIAVYYYG